MKFNFEATGVGSLPFTDPEKSCSFIFETFPDIPFWPQLPRRSFLENMYVQYAEGFPGLLVDEKNRAVSVDTVKAQREIERFYERYLERDIESFGIARDHAAGLFPFLETVRSGKARPPFVKGHITGPISFALSITDENKQPIIYHPELFECAVKLLTLKVVWQIRKLKSVSNNVIIFIDEPHLVSIGSGYINIDANQAKERLEELIAAIKAEDVVCGIHCCGNTDWPFLLSRPIDILNFDAYNFIKQFIIFDKDIKKFLARGGSVAWGIVPTSGDKETKSALTARLEDAITGLTKKGIDREMISSLVTPSCGVGTIDETTAAGILTMAREVSRGLMNPNRTA